MKAVKLSEREWAVLESVDEEKLEASDLVDSMEMILVSLNMRYEKYSECCTDVRNAAGCMKTAEYIAMQRDLRSYALHTQQS